MQPVCTRCLAWVLPSGETREVLVSIFAPFADELEGGDYGCTFRIEAEGVDVERTMYGVDSLQALLHAVRGAEAHLRRLQLVEGMELRWLGMEDLGFGPGALTTS